MTNQQNDQGHETGQQRGSYERMEDLDEEPSLWIIASKLPRCCSH